MPNRSPSKQRLEELIALARTYRGWSNKDLARELGRDVHHLVPDSGVPKLDIVIALAGALDWTVQDVVDDLCGNVPTTSHEKPKETWAELDRAAWSALQAGEYSKAASIARREYLAATNGHERAMACIRECGAWDGVGRYLVAMECCQRGLRERGKSTELTLSLRGNLANFHYVLGNLDEAIGIATRTIQVVEGGDLSTPLALVEAAFSRYVRGASMRASIARGADWLPVDAELAIGDLTGAAQHLVVVAAAQESQIYAATAKICDGARLSIEALSGVRPVNDAIDAYLEFLDGYVEPSKADRVSLEVVGWWSVFAAELALARLDDPDRVEHLLGIFTNKVDEVAARVGNWTFRERLWFFELQRRQSDGGSDEPWTIDAEDAREISGAMARFPHFRAVGWQVFRAAQIGDGQ